jgi:site-specific recombinase XerD
MTLDEMFEQLAPEQQEHFTALLEFATKGKGKGKTTKGALLKKPVDGIEQWRNKLTSEGNSNSTIRGYEYSVAKVLREDPKPTTQSLEARFAARRREVGIEVIRFEQKALKSLFGFLCSRGLWNENPMDDIKLMKPEQKEREVPTDAQVTALLEGEYHLHSRMSAWKFRTILTILAHTGLRVTEAASILRENLNFGPHPSVKVMGKGGKERTVPLSARAGAYALQWLEMTKGINSKYLFPGMNPEKFWDVTAIEEDMKRACEKMGIKPITPHQLRHWWATSTLKNGGKLEVVSKLLGHARLDTTSIYRHISQAELEEDYLKHAPK